MSPKHVFQLGVAVGALALFLVLTLATGNRIEAAAIAIGGALIVTAFFNRPKSS
ncbi:MAG: hypothetical protein HKN03_05315 [Acidimicrobiales bacterium]|nr:hypothetical protein [Acidimicrobiales bacterium]